MQSLSEPTTVLVSPGWKPLEIRWMDQSAVENHETFQCGKCGGTYCACEGACSRCFPNE